MRLTDPFGVVLNLKMRIAYIIVGFGGGGLGKYFVKKYLHKKVYTLITIAGEYNLASVVQFDDLPPIEPRHVVIKVLKI